MTSAGSLFTSCIEQVEPLGIQDLRYAKAEYIRALKDLRAADAEYRRAEAAVQLAIARYEDALTAGVNADTEYQKLLNEYQALVNQDYAGEVAYNEAERLAKLDSLQKAMEVRELNHKRELAEAEKDMRIAQEDLRVTIRNINLACGDLTANEKVAIYEAAAVYYWLTEKSILYKDSVFQAQQKVDTLKEYKERFSDTLWSPGTLNLVNVYEWYQEQIEAEQAKIAFWQEKYDNLPDTSAAIAQWKAYLEAFDNEINAIEVEKAKNVADKAAYDALTNESIRDFDIKIAEWVEKNWKKSGKYYIEPATSAGAKPDSADFISGYADSLEVLLIRPETVTKDVWGKFVYLMNSYEGTKYPFSEADPKNEILKVSTTKDTVTIILRQDMKDYILGDVDAGTETREYEYTVKEDDKNVKKSLPVADYGLLGMYGVLCRDKILGPENDAPSPEDIQEALEGMQDAEAQWVADSTILSKKVGVWPNFTAAETDLKNQIATDGNGAQNMVAAIKDIKKAFSTIEGNTLDVTTGTFDGYDSTELFKAIIAFAQAREQYLDAYKAPKAADIDPKDPVKRDSTVFYYSKGKNGAGKPIVASKKFTELTFEELQKGEYEYYLDDVTPGDQWYLDPTAYRTNAFVNILNQLMGSDFKDVLSTDPIPDVWSQLTSSSNEQITTALYNTWKLDVSYDDPKAIVDAAGEEFKSNELKKKEKALADSVNKYVAAYNRYWATSVPDYDTSMTVVKNYIAALEADPVVAATVTSTRNALVNDVMTACPLQAGNYSRATFKTYNDGAPFVVGFVDGNIVPTTALSVVLNVVDPKLKGAGNDCVIGKVVENVSGILAVNVSKSTDFYKFMKAADNYYNLTNKKASENRAKIRAEIKKVEDALAADAAQAGIFDADTYNQKVATWENNKAKADAYYEAKKAFAGIKSISAKGVVTWNPIRIKYANVGAGMDTVEQGKTAWLKDQPDGVEALFEKNIIGNYAGWKSDLKGEQLEIAIELFGEEPWEQYNEWNLENAQYQAQINELTALKAKAEDVYKAKAKLEGLYDSNTVSAGDGIKTLYEKYAAAYEALQRAIVVFDEYGNIDPKNTTAEINKAYNEIDRLAHEAACYKSTVPDWDGLISIAENELEVLKNRQKTINQAMKLAKENYDRIREYLLSQDGVTYVIPVSTADIDDAIMNIEYLLRSLGHTFVDVYSEVGDKINI